MYKRQAQAETDGEIRALLKTRKYRPEDFPELGDIILGRKTGRVNNEEVTIFDSTGTAFEDLAAMELIEKYSSGFGKEIELIYIPKHNRYAYEELLKLFKSVKK